MPNTLLSHVQIQIAVHWSEGWRGKGFRNEPDKLMLRLVLPKGFKLFQDIKRSESKMYPKVPDMLVYTNMMRTVRVLRVLQRFSMSRSVYHLPGNFYLFPYPLSIATKLSSPSLHLPTTLLTLSFIALAFATHEARTEKIQQMGYLTTKSYHSSFIRFTFSSFWQIWWYFYY